MKRFSTIHTGPGTQSGLSTVSHCLAVGYASLLCPHCELFFTRSSSPQHGPIFLSLYGLQLSYGPENELGLRFSPSPLPSWGFPAFFWETDGQVNTWAVFRCFILSYRRLAIPRAKGFYCPATQQKPELCHGGGLIMVSAATHPTRPCEAQGGLLLIYKCFAPLAPSWLRRICIITIITGYVADGGRQSVL